MEMQRTKRRGKGANSRVFEETIHLGQGHLRAVIGTLPDTLIGSEFAVKGALGADGEHNASPLKFVDEDAFIPYYHGVLVDAMLRLAFEDCIQTASSWGGVTSSHCGIDCQVCRGGNMTWKSMGSGFVV